MDFLDPAKDLRIKVLLYFGYILIGIAITISTIVLVYQAYGFGIDKQGEVIRNGLTFFSSHPNPADIYVNNKRQKVQTNTRLVLPSGIYQVKLTRDGYRDWQRTINLEEGAVQHYDYPFLFPNTLNQNRVEAYQGAPGLVMQSPDHRWLLVQQPGSLSDFEMYDIRSETPAQSSLAVSLPDNLLSSNEGSLVLIEWADNNRHALLRHDFAGQSEYILLDRSAPQESLNLNKTLSINPANLTLDDRKHDKYYAYEAAPQRLSTISLNEPNLVEIQDNVLAYKSYSDDTMLYVTDEAAPAGRVLVRLQSGDTTSTIRSLSAGSSYVVDLTKYDDVMYVAAGAAADNRVYIYQDPVGQRAEFPDQAPTPEQVMRVDQVNYLSFSSSAQFIMAQNGNRFAVYDFENDTGYNYTTAEPLDTPQMHASWMDGNRLMYVSSGQLFVYDYDYQNKQTLTAAGSAYLPAFSPNYNFLYTLRPAENGQFELSQVPTLTPADQ